MREVKSLTRVVLPALSCKILHSVLTFIAIPLHSLETWNYSLNQGTEALRVLNKNSQPGEQCRCFKNMLHDLDGRKEHVYDVLFSKPNEASTSQTVEISHHTVMRNGDTDTS